MLRPPQRHKHFSDFYFHLLINFFASRNWIHPQVSKHILNVLSFSFYSEVNRGKQVSISNIKSVITVLRRRYI